MPIEARHSFKSAKMSFTTSVEFDIYQTIHTYIYSGGGVVVVGAFFCFNRRICHSQKGEDEVNIEFYVGEASLFATFFTLCLCQFCISIACRGKIFF